MYWEIKGQNNERGNIYELRDLLEMCITYCPMIIGLSIGTVRLSDAVIIYPVICKLSQAGTLIVASMSNAGFITFSASFKEVIGVIAENTPPQKFPHIFQACRNDYGVNIISEYKRISSYTMEDNSITHYMDGNSYVVPVVLSYFYKELLKEREKEDIMKLII